MLCSCSCSVPPDYHYCLVRCSCPHFFQSPETNRYLFIILWARFVACALFYQLSAFLWNNLGVIREIARGKGNSLFNGDNLWLHFNVLFTSFLKHNWLGNSMAAQCFSYSLQMLKRSTYPWYPTRRLVFYSFLTYQDAFFLSNRNCISTQNKLLKSRP